MKYYEGIRCILRIPRLSPGAKLVLISLYDRQGIKKSSWPSVDTISKNCGLARSTVIRRIKELTVKKLVSVSHPNKPAHGRTNKYSVCLTGVKMIPVSKRDRYQNDTATGVKMRLKPVSKCDPNVLIERTQYNEMSNSSAATKNVEAEIAFGNARQLYPGTKRSCPTEFKDFKKHKDWKRVVALLEPAIQREIDHKSQLRALGKFCPPWKNFKSWISQRCWEQEFPEEDENQLTQECDPDVAMALERSMKL